MKPLYIYDYRHYIEQICIDIITGNIISNNKFNDIIKCFSKQDLFSNLSNKLDSSIYINSYIILTNNKNNISNYINFINMIETDFANINKKIIDYILNSILTQLSDFSIM